MAQQSTSAGTAPRGPRSLRERRRRQPTRASRALLACAVAVLPRAHRDRYSVEVLAELHDLDRPAQWRHAMGVLLHAGQLRVAITGADVSTERGPDMRRSLRCAMHLHRYVKRHNPEASPPAQTYLECARCGHVRDIPLRPPAGYLGM